MSRMRILTTALLAFTALVALRTGAAEAHAYLQHAMPLVGSTIPASPPEVTLEYSEAIEPRFSSVMVTDADGQRVDKSDLHVAPANPKRIVIGLLPLKQGTYRVEWHITSVDTHRTEGKFTFSVQP
jgi:methionine-rich copper-binding protein CopC